MQKITLAAGRPRLLLSSEDDDVRRLVAEALRAEGYEVVQVSDVERLLMTAAWELPFGLLVSEVRSATGAIPFLEQIRDKGWKMPVVLISPPVALSARARAAELGAVIFDMPLHTQTVLAAVGHLLRRRMI